MIKKNVTNKPKWFVRSIILTLSLTMIAWLLPFNCQNANAKTAKTYQTSISNATNISLNTNYNGTIAENRDANYYCFTLPSSGSVTLDANARMRQVYYRIYDSKGNEIWSANPYWDSTIEAISTNETIDLTKGTYYFVVEKYSYTGNYSFELAYASAGESFSESGDGTDNTMDAANVISLDTNYKGQLAENDEKDFYKFTMGSSGRITLVANARMNWVYYRIYDSKGNEVWSANPYWDNTTKAISTNETIDLTKGTYYFVVEKYSYTGNYSFELSTNTKKNTQIKGTSKRKSVTSVTKPKKVTTSKPKSKKSRTLTVSWKANPAADGYQVVIAKDKKFKKGRKSAIVNDTYTTKKTFKKLAKKKVYYAKVRAYKYVGTTKLYGNYSKTKKARVR